MSNLYENIFKEISKFKVSANEGITFGQAEQLQKDIERLNERLYYLFSVNSTNDTICEKLQEITDFAKNTENGRGSKRVINGVKKYIVLHYENAQFLYQKMSEISELLGEKI